MDDVEVPAYLQPLHEESITGEDEEKAKQVKKLLIEYADIFSKGPDDLGRTELVKHHIQTTDGPPIRQRPWRLPHVLREEASRAMEEMKQHGVIEPSCSPLVFTCGLGKEKGWLDQILCGLSETQRGHPQGFLSSSPY